ncbi:MAG: hypothetical protein HC767_09820 [Akkermansiaceae bacterium]|nr:hypothetical protein [Akkermansiaceae bacterium]
MTRSNVREPHCLLRTTALGSVAGRFKEEFYRPLVLASPLFQEIAPEALAGDRRRPGPIRLARFALQHAQIIFLVGALFVGIAFQSFVFILLAFQAALWSQWRLQRRGIEPSPVAEKLAANRRAATA